MNAPGHLVSRFLRTVKEMRDSQRDYFRTRDKNVLRVCKVSERAVDEQLRQLAPYYPTVVPMSKLSDMIVTDDPEPGIQLQMPLL